MILFGNAPIDSPRIDAFNRIRVSEPLTIFDSKQLIDKQPLFWDEEIGGSATSVHSTINAATTMSVTSSASDFVIRQTKNWFNYQPGKSQMILFTFFTPKESGVTKRIGYFNGTGTDNLTPNNGIFLEVSGTTTNDVSWNIAKNGTTTEHVTQANWNVDKLDGTGPSGLNIVFDATHIGMIDFEWLGTGRVRVGFIFNGIIIYCHYFNHSNNPSFTSVYMSSPNLPVRYSIESNGSSGSMQHICSSVISEGGIQETGSHCSFNTGTTGLSTITLNTTYAIIGVRKKTTHTGITIDPEAISLINTSKEDFAWSLHINPTVDGTFTYNDQSNCALQVAYGNNTNLISSPGYLLDSGYASGTTLVANKVVHTVLKLGTTIAGVRDTLVLAVTPLAGGEIIQASITIRESL